MRYISDFHIHSHYSRATSKHLTPEHLHYWARIKGINVVGTGDCIHPGWLDELREKFEMADNGLYRLKKSAHLPLSEQPFQLSMDTPVYFMLTTEISSIYKKNGKVRKVHNVCVFPDIDTAAAVQAKLSHIGNIESDGRPILGLDARDLVEIIMETSDRAYVIPAHIWTPWFSVLGSKSGFDSIEECFEDMSQYIFALETGLSSDPPMNRVCSFLDRYQLVSNSDAHSPEKLGREANLFDTEFSYDGMYNALKTGDGFSGTVEFFPQEGKYFYDGHRKCALRWNPLETISHNGICPVCGSPVTRGVMYRIAELADRPVEEIPHQKDFFSITSLPDILCEIHGTKSITNKVRADYFRTITTIGSEFHTLLFADTDEIKSASNDLLAEAISRIRRKEVHISEGYDGEFGRITVFDKSELDKYRHGKLFLFQHTEDIADTTEKSPNDSQKSVKFNIHAFQERYNQMKTQSVESAESATSITAPANNDQQKAIEFGMGACMVIAGPGSGKTRILTKRIARLIREKIVPGKNILAITFSNKAAQEMRERVAAQIEEHGAHISTFHALGLHIIKEHVHLCGRKETFRLLDHDEKIRYIESLSSSKREASNLASKIEAFKHGIENGEDIRDSINAYAQLLRNINAFDLDDLIYVPVCLLNRYPELQEEYSARYRFILIDEYQDINARQYELVRLLAPRDNPNLFVIGDPDQAIYGFRGSDVRLIDQFKTDYPLTECITLHQSYRCPAPILYAAGQVIRKTSHIHGKTDTIKIKVFECSTDISEADQIAATIERMIGGVRSFSIESGMSDGTEYQNITGFSDFAVLCRTAHMFDPFIQAFNNHGIAYQVVNNTPFYQQEPLRTLIGAIKALYYAEHSYDISLPPPLSNEITSHIDAHGDIGDLFAKIFKHEVIEENIAARMIRFARGFGADYLSFFRSAATREGTDDFEYHTEAVSLMTMHASKGLEFNTVFIPGCETGVIPFELFGKKNDSELAEEERLFYVGATRSKKYLFLSHAHRRTIMNRTVSNNKSYLLERVEKELLVNEKRESGTSVAHRQLSLFN